jgi:hypothetical protein
MANITGWVPGRLTGTTWATAFNASDLASLPSGASVLSSLTPFANDGAGVFDQLVKISVKLAITSTLLTAGSCVTIWLAEQLDDLTNFGDGGLTAGTQATYTPPWEPLCVIPMVPQATTKIWGVRSNLLLPPSTFALILQNSLTATANPPLSASGNTIKILTGNVNTNAS